MGKSFFSVKRAVTTEIEVKKSKFICDVARVSCDEEAKAFVKEIKKKYADARHNCYAYIADEKGAFMKYSDDGEPSGTAGLPMLEVLKGRGLYCTATVVTRYFGGILLGTGGLSRAYSDSVVKAIDSAGIVENVYSNVYSLDIPFNLYKVFLKSFERRKIIIKSTIFGADGVSITLAIPFEDGQIFDGEVGNLSLGKGVLKLLESGYEIYE